MVTRRGLFAVCVFNFPQPVLYADIQRNLSEAEREERTCGGQPVRSHATLCQQEEKSILSSLLYVANIIKSFAITLRIIFIIFDISK